MESFSYERRRGRRGGREWLGLSCAALSPGSCWAEQARSLALIGLEEQLCWLRLDSDGEGSQAALAAAGVDRRTHLSFSLIFLRIEG